MIINGPNLRGIYVGYNTIFNKAFAEHAPLYKEIAMETPSTTDAETYGWCDLQIEGDKLVGITPTERPPELEPEPQPPSAEDITLDMLAEHEERLCMLEITTNAV